MEKINAVITGVGGYVPDYILTNDEISKMVDECPENFYTEHYRRDIPLLLDYIYRYFDSFKLMVPCGQRNVWNGFIRRLAVIETEYAKKVSSDVWFSKTF